ncbi:hypothetical protein WA158_005854 [Blastocystis sp. Blastoise]
MNITTYFPVDDTTSSRCIKKQQLNIKECDRNEIIQQAKSTCSIVLNIDESNKNKETPVQIKEKDINEQEQSVESNESLKNDVKKKALIFVNNCMNGSLDDDEKHFLRRKNAKGIYEYNSDYLVYGFIQNYKSQQGQCLICNTIIKRVQPSRFFTHFLNHIQTESPTVIIKFSYQYFEELYTKLQRSQLLLKKNTISNDMLIKFSYGISNLVAKTGLPYTTANKLILPVIRLWENLNKRSFYSIIMSANTVKRRINDINDLEEISTINELNSSPLFSLQLDESTDISHSSQLILFVRYMYNNKYKDSFLCILQLQYSKSGSSIFETVSNYFSDHDIQWNKCLSVCTDGASAMNGNYNSFKTCVLKIQPSCLFIHCYLHKEEICSSVLPDYFQKYFIECSQIINSITQSTKCSEKLLNLQRSLIVGNDEYKKKYNKETLPDNISNSSVLSFNEVDDLDFQFEESDENYEDDIIQSYDETTSNTVKTNGSKVTNKNNNENTNSKSYRLLHYSSTRWLSRYQSISRFNMLKSTIETILLEDKKKDLYSKITDKEFSLSMIYIEEITELFYDVNKKMQGKKAIFLEYIMLIKELYIKLCNKFNSLCDDKISVFPTVASFLRKNIDISVKFFINIITDHIDTLLTNIENYFPEVMSLIEFECNKKRRSLKCNKNPQTMIEKLCRSEEKRLSTIINMPTTCISQEKCYGNIISKNSKYEIICAINSYNHLLITGELRNQIINGCTYYDSICDSYFFGYISGNFSSKETEEEKSVADNMIINTTKRKSPINSPITNMYDISNLWVIYPFETKYISVTKYDIPLYEELLVLSCDVHDKNMYNTLSIDSFYCELALQYPIIYQHVTPILLPFPTSYLCEKAFSEMLYLKSKYRNHLNIAAPLRIKLSTNEPSLDTMTDFFKDKTKRCKFS